MSSASCEHKQREVSSPGMQEINHNFIQTQIKSLRVLMYDFVGTFLIMGKKAPLGLHLFTRISSLIHSGYVRHTHTGAKLAS